MTLTKNVWKAAALLLILALISAVMISGTYAKYTSEYAGQDTALVAKWNIVASGSAIGMDWEAHNLDLFQHTSSHVASPVGDDYIIAPGVSGDFTLAFVNNSEVDAKIGFTIAENGSADVPIEFSLQDDFAPLLSDVGALKAELDGDSELRDLAMGESVEKKVYWRWPEADDNARDTTLGENSFDSRISYGLTITASAVQVLPSELGD